MSDPINEAIADADALILLDGLRRGNAAGFHMVTRIISRILRRVVMGCASKPVRGKGNADMVILSLLYGCDADDRGRAPGCERIAARHGSTAAGRIL